MQLDKKLILRATIRANYQILDYKHELKKLNTLRQVYEKLELRLSTTHITDRENYIKNKIKDLKKFVSYRMFLLLNWDKKNAFVFCEAYKKDDGEYDIQKDSITTRPIDSFGTTDINNGFIELTRVYLNKKLNLLVLEDMIFNLKTGEMEPCYSYNLNNCNIKIQGKKIITSYL